jgi:hypothetical protein
MPFSSLIAMLFVGSHFSGFEAAERTRPQVNDPKSNLVVEIQSVSGPAGFLDWKDFDKCDWRGKPSYLFRSDKEVQEFLESMQAHRRINIMQAPRLNVIDGLATTALIDLPLWIQPWQSKRSYNGNVIFTPGDHDDSIRVGVRIDLRPAVSPDRKKMELTIMGEFLQTAGPLDVMPIPIAAGLPFLVPKSKVVKRAFENRFAIELGRTLLLSPGDIEIDFCQPTFPPVFSKNPYLKRLLNNVTGGHKHQALILFTPRLAKPEDAKVVEGVGEEFLEK